MFTPKLKFVRNGLLDELCLNVWFFKRTFTASPDIITLMSGVAKRFKYDFYEMIIQFKEPQVYRVKLSLIKEKCVDGQITFKCISNDSEVMDHVTLSEDRLKRISAKYVEGFTCYIL